MLRIGGLCDWGRKGRPIENVNGLRASRDWGQGRELTSTAGEVKPRQLGRFFQSHPIGGHLQDGAFRRGGAEARAKPSRE
jgi:hypothetical protein